MQGVCRYQQEAPIYQISTSSAGSDIPSVDGDQEWVRFCLFLITITSSVSSCEEDRSTAFSPLLFFCLLVGLHQLRTEGWRLDEEGLCNLTGRVKGCFDCGGHRELPDDAFQLAYSRRRSCSVCKH